MRFNTSCMGLLAGPIFLQQPRMLRHEENRPDPCPADEHLYAHRRGSKYIAVTKDYSVYIGTKKPIINPENDSVSFEDETGKTHTIPREDLKQVRPLP